VRYSNPSLLEGKYLLLVANRKIVPLRANLYQITNPLDEWRLVPGVIKSPFRDDETSVYTDSAGIFICMCLKVFCKETKSSTHSIDKAMQYGFANPDVVENVYIITGNRGLYSVVRALCNLT